LTCDPHIKDIVRNFPSLAGVPVLVTGGATGIGEAIVRKFVAEGARVALIDISRTAAEKLQTELGSDALHIDIADLRDAGAIASVVARIIATIGTIRVLVNNAAHDERHEIGAVTPEFWRERLAVNLDHQFFCAQAVIPGMSDGSGGSIVNMGSLSWHLGLGHLRAYVTAKAAIEGLTRGLARDLGPHRIRVNCVVPGFVKTHRQVEKWLTPELEAAVRAGQCLPDLIEPEYVANMVAFLAADESRMCTAQTYAVDAGWL
jgi:NAD(P)-dependent dehydrogenase (short-subunit alcohol dehydrogenase family)